MKCVEYAVELLSVTPDSDRLIERAGRTAYQSQDKITDESAEAFVRMLIKRGHESVLEHASATVRIICDRGTSHEWVRHRIASFTQESTRYCRYGYEISVIQPMGMTIEVAALWRESVTKAESTYLAMLSTGVSPQVARAVLPICLKTEIVMTANFREWRHILKLRLSPAAHPHMRHVAGLIQKELMGISQCFRDEEPQSDLPNRQL